jgi:hypothetical protein
MKQGISPISSIVTLSQKMKFKHSPTFLLLVSLKGDFQADQNDIESDCSLARRDREKISTDFLIG